jgi:hypothetical protein
MAGLASGQVARKRRVSGLGRQIRFYGKKRGDRRTGSGSWGSAGLAMFFGCVLALGCALLAVILATVVIPEWRANHRLVANRCLVMKKRIAERNDPGGTVYRPEFLIQYQAGGQTYQSWTYDIARAYSSGKSEKQAVLDNFQIGQEYPCWHDPGHPETVVLVRGYTWFAWTMMLVPVTFIAIGGGGLAYRLLSGATSAERRAALAQRMTQLDLFDLSDVSGGEYPGVPPEADLTNSPGTRLAYRLPLSASAGWALAVLLLAAVVWNGMVAAFMIVDIRSHLAGNPDWLLTALNVPFLLIGLGLAWFAVRRLLVTAGVGPTLVEISAHPLRPAGQYEVFLSQTGRLKVNSLKLLLVCQEQATYQQGTNTRTEMAPVYEQEIFAREQFEIEQDAPLEVAAEMRVPARAMHSFKSGHNQIAWKLIVRGDVVGWPNYQREFPLLVYPGAGGTGSL